MAPSQIYMLESHDGISFTEMYEIYCVLLDDTMIYMKKIFQHIYKHMISIWIEKNQIILTLELLCSCKLTYGCQRRCMSYA